MTSTISPRTTDVESQTIRALSKRWLEAADTRDPALVASFYARDGTFLVPNVPLAQGRAAVREVWTQLLSAPNLSLVWTPISIEVAQAGDMACEIGSYQLGMDGPAGRIEDDGKYVVVWRKGDDGWQVAADIFNSSRPLT